MFKERMHDFFLSLRHIRAGGSRRNPSTTKRLGQKKNLSDVLGQNNRKKSTRDAVFFTYRFDSGGQ